MEKSIRKKIREEINDVFTKKQINELNIKNSSFVLELGAGYGSIANWLTSVISNSGVVMATEIKNDCLEELKKINNDNLIIKKHDIVNDTLPEDKYDFIHARFLLEHLSNHEELLIKLQNSLKNEGIIFIEDADYFSTEIEGTPEYKQIMKLYRQSIEDEGSNFSSIKKLPYVFNKIGLKILKTEGRISLFRGGSIEANFFIKNLNEYKDSILKKNITEEFFKKAITDLTDENNWFSGPIIFSVIGRK